MAKLYRITPVDKKSVEYFVDVFERRPDGSIRGFDVTEVWRWGQGFREVDDPVWEFEIKNGVRCDPQIGWGCELDDLISVYVNFTDGFTEQEKEEIQARLQGELDDSEGRWGTAWLYDGDHKWEVEEDHVRIIAPVKIDLVDEATYLGLDTTFISEVIKENIQPVKDGDQPDVVDWPFDRAGKEELTNKTSDNKQ